MDLLSPILAPANIWGRGVVSKALWPVVREQWLDYTSAILFLLCAVCTEVFGYHKPLTLKELYHQLGSAQLSSAGLSKAPPFWGSHGSVGYLAIHCVI